MHLDAVQINQESHQRNQEKDPLRGIQHKQARNILKILEETTNKPSKKSRALTLSLL